MSRLLAPPVDQLLHASLPACDFCVCACAPSVLPCFQFTCTLPAQAVQSETVDGAGGGKRKVNTYGCVPFCFLY